VLERATAKERQRVGRAESINQEGDGRDPRDIPVLSEFAAAEFERLSSRISQMVTLEIVIPVASHWPTREELTARNLVEDALMASPWERASEPGAGWAKWIWLTAWTMIQKSRRLALSSRKP